MTSMTLSIYAQENKNNIEFQYTTEGQYNFQGRGTWVNLLDFQADIATESLGGWKNGYFNVQFISVYRSSKERIADDLQVFSNIDAESMFLGMFILGYTHRLGKKIELFAGLRNINRDYFTAPYTSFFTNSSCGIYPTLSANFPMANYPLSAMCLHAEYRIMKNILLKNSLYNGVAHGYGNHWRHLFTVFPKQEGIFNITQLSFANNRKNHGIYSIGFAGCSLSGYNGENYGKKEKINYSLWGNIEQNVYKDPCKEFGILLQAGYAPQDRNFCRAYYGMGAVASGLFSKDKKDQLGLIVNKAVYSGISETAFEASLSYPVLKILSLQPAFHYIVTGNKHSSIGMLRAVFLLK